MRETMISCLHRCVAKEEWDDVSDFANRLRENDEGLDAWKFLDAERNKDEHWFTNRIKTLRGRVKLLRAYLLDRVDAGDWHGVADAANDIREVEAAQAAFETIEKENEKCRAQQKSVLNSEAS
tara:strand:- start:399 stop:767 length:369 start_codon:yes stop_codon:yes gene_type:complete